MSNPGRKNRSLRNVKLTRKHHYQYFGLWIVLFVSMLLALNGVTYLYMRERMASAGGTDAMFASEYGVVRQLILGAMGLEVLLISVAFIVLAKFSAHRIAGPYIRLRNTFKQVGDGDLSVRLRFRGYDRLDDTAAAFNAMMEALEKRMESKHEDD